MANTLYKKYKEASLNADVDLLVDNIKAALIDTGTYTFSQTHDFLDDVSGIVATSGNLASKVTTDGTFDAADITFTAVSGSTVEAIILYKDTGTASTSNLIAYIDTATGLPLTPSGSDVQVVWSSGADKIFTI